MGLKVSAREAALLAHKTERTIRTWVASGKLRAEPTGARARRPGVGPNRWLIDVDALAQMPGVTLDRVRLAELELRASEASLSISLVERVERLEHEVEALRQQMHVLQDERQLPRTRRRKGRDRLE
jgi:polyhydroxyalkanoate synthesis regulator phasin